MSMTGRWNVIPKLRRLARPVRIAIGGLLIILGLLGFLPVLGFWMIPLGLYALSIDFAAIRRLRRRLQRWWGRLRRNRAQSREAAD